MTGNGPTTPDPVRRLAVVPQEPGLLKSMIRPLPDDVQPSARFLEALRSRLLALSPEGRAKPLRAA